jgi:hypothetical protein
MPDYKLYYWSVPFRGQFVRAVLAFAGKTWIEAGDDAISKLMGGQYAIEHLARQAGNSEGNCFVTPSSAFA